MSRFKVGDYITGLPSANTSYYLTTEDALLKVVKMIDNHSYDISVKILDCKDQDQVGNSYPVESRFFRKVGQRV